MFNTINLKLILYGQNSFILAIQYNELSFFYFASFDRQKLYKCIQVNKSNLSLNLTFFLCDFFFNFQITKLKKMEKAISRQKILLHHLNPSSSTHVNESSSLYVCFISFLCFFQLLFSIMAFSSCCPFLPISLNSVFNLWENYPFANFARIISFHWSLAHNFVKVLVLNVCMFIQ